MTAVFFGKYRGVVLDNDDPLRMLRIQATVPDVLGAQPSGWAMPCLPFGGSQAGFFALPAVGSGVWMEFEHGDPDYPVWTGCYWGSANDVPPQLQVSPPTATLLLTAGGHSLLLDDDPGAGGITLTTSNGARIAMTSSGIEIDNGNGATVTLSGSSVSVNNGALEVS